MVIVIFWFLENLVKLAEKKKKKDLNLILLGV